MLQRFGHFTDGCFRDKSNLVAINKNSEGEFAVESGFFYGRD